MRSSARGFTLLEMMVVVTICLMMMIVIVPVFQVATRTVRVVEQKLALYEAARNILDIFEFELMQAAVNERGEHFSIKSCHYQDNDTFTDSRGIAPATQRYSATSRREADAVNFAKLQAGGFRYANDLLEAGSMAYPLCYPEAYYRTPEFWKCSLRSTLLYPLYFDPAQDIALAQPTRDQQKADVSAIQMQVVSDAFTSEYAVKGNLIDPSDFVFDTLAPGHEIKLVGEGKTAVDVRGGSVREDPARRTLGLREGVGSGTIKVDMKATRQAEVSGIRLMDLDVAYWDDAERKFKDPPDHTVIYFAPPPKAVRATITVCDLAKRGMLTLRRIIQLPVANGDGAVASATDTFYWDANGRNAFNRPKSVKALEAGLDLP